jgi:aspartyl-tRNA(Asn)/glutamyl-tRNA(Gln) amidotransferase subunit A
VTILEVSAKLASRTVSSVELTQASLQAIGQRKDLNAFLAMMEDRALAKARAMDAERAQGNVRGPLHGVPVAVKDVFCTAGTATTCGSRLFADHVPNYDAAVVEKLEAAGAVIVGKTHMHELAYGVTSNNPHFGPVRNPHDLNRIPGGSSGGSAAAVAAGLVFMAMGTDTGGSIRSARRLLWNSRNQAHHRPREPVRRAATGLHARPHGSAHALGSRCRHRAPGAGRLRPPRRLFEPRAG